MKAQYIFYLSDHRLLVYLAESQRITELHRFAANENGQEQFAAWLDGLRPLPVRLIIDSRMEESQVEIVPHVAWHHRRGLLQHRLKRSFTQTPYHYAKVQRRLSAQPGAKRNDDQLFLTGLHNAEWLKPWLKLLLARQFPLRGIYSFPLLLEKLLKPLNTGANTLLVTHGPRMNDYSPQGLRQSFFRQRCLRVSRLLPLTAVQLDDYAHYARAEIYKTQQYLDGRNLLPVEQPLELLLLSGDPWQEYCRTWEQETGKDGDWLFRCVHLADLAKQLGLREALPELHVSALSAWLLARQGETNHYALPEQRRYLYYRYLRRALYASSAAVLFSGLGLAGSVAYEGLEEQKQLDALRAEVRQIQDKYAQAREQQKKLSGIGVDVVHIKNTVDSADFLQRQQLDMYADISRISRYLNDFPELVLAQLSWESRVIKEKKTDDATLRRPMTTLEKMMANRGLDKNAQAEMQRSGVLTLSGELSPFDGNYTKALSTIHNFVSQLRADAWIKTVNTLQMPLNIQPNAKLSGVVGTARSKGSSEQHRAPFKLEVIMNNESAQPA